MAIAGLEGMHPFPHRYSAWAIAGPDADVVLEGDRFAPLQTNVPPEFGGAGGCWSPETLLVAAVADCFALTFRGLAAKARLPWISLACHVIGTLDRVECVTRFVQFHVHAQLQVPEGVEEDRARRLLEKAEATCLITRSLAAPTVLETVVETAVAQIV
jgi:organic hydroperoxide reductase OsmC/OhrA